MSGWREQLARLFIEPPSSTAAPPPRRREIEWLTPHEAQTPPSPALSRVAVVCAAGDARVAGGAAGLALMDGASCPPVVAGWTGRQGAAASDRAGSPAARRLASRLRAAGEEAVAAGRLVRLPLPADEEQAATLTRTASRRLDSPVVLVVSGPRGTAMEAALAEAQRILLVVSPSSDAGLAELAAEELSQLASCQLVELASSPAAAAMARTGTALVAPLKAPFVAALRD